MPNMQPETAPSLFVCIIGGGLAGLSCALSLQAVGIQCKVFERDESMTHRKQGYGLTLTNSRTGALAQLGVLDECLAQDCASRCHYVFDQQGVILGYFGRCFLEEDGDEKVGSNKKQGDVMTHIPTSPRQWRSANLRIPRQNLRQMLLDRLQPNTVVWGARVMDYHETADKVTVTFHDGSVVDADVLVGADGINSVIRKMQDHKTKQKNGGLEYLGVAAIIGLSTATHPLLHERGFYTIGNQHRLFTMPFRDQAYGHDGSLIPPLTMWQLSFAESSEETARSLSSTPPTELLELAFRRTQGWMDPVQELLAGTEEVWATPIYDRTPRKLKTQQPSRVTVMGDACHPMSMFKGQGANQALQDGPLLARMLTSTDRNLSPSRLDSSGRSWLDRAALLNRIRRFECEMIQRTDRKTLASRQAAIELHSVGVADRIEFGIGGVSLSSEQLALVLRRCREQNIGAHLAAELDNMFGELVDNTVPPAERGTKTNQREDDD